MAPRKTALPLKIDRNTPQTKDAKNYSEDKPPSRWWGNPFFKGFMYTAGAALAIIGASAIATLIGNWWTSFEPFSILNGK